MTFSIENILVSSPSYLTEKTTHNTDFDKFIAGSKVVDDKGDPLKVYHGSPKYGYITKFKKGNHGALGPGIYFTDDYSEAERYSNKNGKSGIFEVYLQIRKPFIVEGVDGTETFLRKLYGTDSIYRRRSREQGNDNYIIEQKDIRKLLEKGYDGVIWLNDSFNEYVVYSDDQIFVIDDNSTTIKKIKSFKTDEGKFSVWDVDTDHRRADMFTVWESNDGWIVRNALVPEDKQQQGIATDFYIRMNKLSILNTGNPLRSTQPRVLTTGAEVHELSSLGVKLWDSLVTKGYAKKLGNKNYVFI